MHELKNIAPFLKAADDRQSEVARLFELLEESRQRAAAARAAFDLSRAEKDLREAAKLFAEVNSLAETLGSDMKELQRIERERCLHANCEAWRALAADFASLLKESRALHDSKQKTAGQAILEYVGKGGDPFRATEYEDSELSTIRACVRKLFGELSEIRDYRRHLQGSHAQAAEMASGLANDSRKFSSYLAKAQAAVAWLATNTQAR